MFILNGKVLKVGNPFNHKGLQYPGDWLGQSTAAQRAEIGIVTRSAPKKLQTGFDTRFWFGVDEPRDLEQVRSNLINDQAKTCGDLLSKTDWYIVRRADIGTEVPAEVADHRLEVRQVHATNLMTLQSAESIEELEELNKTAILPYPFL